MTALLTAPTPNARTLHIDDDEAGFHGDHYVLKLVEHVMAYAHAFVETGTYMGQTAAYVGRNYPHMPYYSCEQDAARHARNVRLLAPFRQVHLHNQVSPDFLYDVHDRHPELRQQTNLYWLDAHGFGFDQWPLRQEVEFLTTQLDSALIMIDDFKVPNRPEFGFDAYKGEVCAIEYIYHSIKPGRTYHLVYPTYTETTSKAHKLRGVGLLFYNVPGFEWPEHLARHFQAYEFTK